MNKLKQGLVYLLKAQVNARGGGGEGGQPKPPRSLMDPLPSFNLAIIKLFPINLHDR